jgi:cytochrome c
MSSLERNKVFAAVLLAGLIAMLTGFFARVTVAPDEPAKPAYQVASTEAAAPATPDAKPPEPIAPLLLVADAAAGEKYARVCAACHSFGKGEPAKVGPNLYGIVNNKHAHMEGYAYSDAMKAQQGPWDYQALATFLANPKGTVPGTKMGFAGIHSEKDEANVIAWLRTLSDDPAPLPAK